MVPFVSTFPVQPSLANLIRWIEADDRVAMPAVRGSTSLTRWRVGYAIVFSTMLAVLVVLGYLLFR